MKYKLKESVTEKQLKELKFYNHKLDNELVWVSRWGRNLIEEDTSIGLLEFEFYPVIEILKDRRIVLVDSSLCDWLLRNNVWEELKAKGYVEVME